MQHIYGYLWTVLLGNFLNVVVINVRGWSVPSFENIVRSGDLVVGYPGAWKRWVEVKWPGGVSGVSSGGGVPQGLPNSLLDRGLGRWSEIYGCTELGAVGIREGLASEFMLAPYWPARMAGIHTPDALNWLDERRFLLGRRLDGLVEISGMQVDLAKLREVMLQLSGVREIVLRKHEDEIQAIVIGSIGQEELRCFVEAELPAWERPKRLWIRKELPLDAAGKPLFDLEAGIDV